MTRVCGTGTRCERHDIALHGYPCHACQLEWERRSPRVRALISRQANGKGATVTPAQVTRARVQDQQARETYDGEHVVTVERAGEHGPVARLWNAVCLPECGWSHYWLKSESDAQTEAEAHG